MLVLLLALALASIVSSPAPVFAAPADSTTRWALVLSGGLARGLAHVGVLRALEEEGVRPDLIVGSSMGSLIGAMWASGRTSGEIQELFRQVDAQGVLDVRPTGSWWRGHVTPRPWITLLGGNGWLRLPTGMLDDAALNDLLARYLLNADGLAQGDFDRLGIPWRAVATDLEWMTPLVLDSGGVARAVRTSISMPVFLPAIYDGTRLLADGGVTNHLPIKVAQADTIDHVLAIDVALPLGRFDENTSIVNIATGMFQQMSRHGRLQGRPGRDVVIWLPMPGISPIDLRRSDEVAEIGYRAARDTIARLAREWRLTKRPESGASAVLPRLGSMRWVTREGRPARMARSAYERMGTLPSGRFEPETLASGLARVHRADLFRSAWPSFQNEGDETKLRVDVREHARFELAASAGFDRDQGGRLAIGASLRPMAPPWPDVLVAGGTWRRFGASAFASLEPRSLARGATGLFLRAGARRTETRIFDRDRRWLERVTRRGELIAGAQVRLPTGDLVQAGAGVGRLWGAGGGREGAMAIVRAEAHGRRSRTVEAVVFGGSRRYGTIRGVVSTDLPTGLVSIRPSVFAGWGSRQTPLDELHGAGGPATLVGFRHGEWLGRRALGSEIRLVRHLATAIDVDGYVQAAHVEHAVSRADLADRVQVAAGIGLRMNVPFGPLAVDLGLGEGGVRRIEFSFGPEF